MNGVHSGDSPRFDHSSSFIAAGPGGPRLLRCGFVAAMLLLAPLLADFAPRAAAQTLPVIEVAPVAYVTEGENMEFSLRIRGALHPQDLEVSIRLQDDTRGRGRVLDSNSWRGQLITATIPANTRSVIVSVPTIDDNEDEDGAWIEFTPRWVSGSPFRLGASAEPFGARYYGPYTWGLVRDNDAPATCDATSADLVQRVRGYHEGNLLNYGDAWLRILIAFGAETHETLEPYTAAEAWTSEVRDRYGRWGGWPPLRRELEALEECARDAANPPSPSPQKPSITVSGGDAVVEGGAATFTLTATPAPAAAVSVSVAVSEQASRSNTITEPSARGLRTVIIDASGTATFTVPTVDNDRDESGVYDRYEEVVEATVTPGSGYTVGAAAMAKVKVMDDDAPQPQRSEEESSDPAPEQSTDTPLTIDIIRGYAAETENGQAHVDRWLRVLAALGEDNGHTPMTAAEAQTYADRGWTRWDTVADLLTKLEALQTPEPEPESEPEPEPEPAPCVSDDLRSDVSGYSQETHEGQAHVGRWLQVLAAFGEDNGQEPMTAAEAQTYADRGWSRWDPVVEALRCLEARASGTQAHVPLVPGASSPAPGVLTLSNLSPQAGQVRITAIDDGGWRRGPLTLDMEAGASVSLSSQDLERGNRFKGLDGAAGPGAGDWRLELSSGLDLEVGAHVLGADGARSALDAAAPAGAGARQVAWFPSAVGGSGRHGLLRIVNHSPRGGTVRIVPHDALGNAYPPLTLRLGAGGAANLDAWDLELGNAAKGLAGSAGPGVGDWRLEVSSGLDIEVLPYLVAPGGLIESAGDALAPAELR